MIFLQEECDLFKSSQNISAIMYIIYVTHLFDAPQFHI